MAITVGAPTKTSRRLWCEAQTILSAATSGWKIGGTGWGWLWHFERHQVNCGVFIAGSCTIVRWMFLRSWISSVRSESVKPAMACFAPQ